MASSLRIEGIHAGYGAVRVIEDVSIGVGAGETVVLLGTNGNGKSTLMKCVMGLVRPSAGAIVADIDGVAHDLTRLTHPVHPSSHGVPSRTGPRRRRFPR